MVLLPWPAVIVSAPLPTRMLLLHPVNVTPSLPSPIEISELPCPPTTVMLPFDPAQVGVADCPCTRLFQPARLTDTLPAPVLTTALPWPALMTAL